MKSLASIVNCRFFIIPVDMAEIVCVTSKLMLSFANPSSGLGIADFQQWKKCIFQTITIEVFLVIFFLVHVQHFQV